MAGSLLSYLFDRFGVRREVVLTSALHHVLCQSDAAWSAFLSVADGAGGTLPRDMTLREQVSGADGSRPDLVGEINGAKLLLVELKLGAQLTSRQPARYVEILSPGQHGVLLFVVPRHRVTRITEEVAAKLSNPTQAPDTIAKEVLPSGALSLSLGGGRHVVVVDWQSVLQRMRAAVAQVDEQGTLSDIDQLEGMFKTVDEFIPFTKEDLGVQVPAKLYQLYNLLYELKELAVSTPASPLYGHFQPVPHSRDTWVSWGFDMKMDGVPVRLHLQFDLWLTLGSSPIWLSIRVGDADRADRLWDAFKAAGIEQYDDEDDRTLITLPLSVPVGQSESESLTHLADRLQEIRSTAQAVVADVPGAKAVRPQKSARRAAPSSGPSTSPTKPPE